MATIPKLEAIASRINSQDMQRSNLYYVRLPLALMLSAGLGATVNSALGKTPIGGIGSILPVNDQLNQAIASVTSAVGALPRQLTRLGAKFGSSNSADALVVSVGIPGLDATAQDDPLDALQDQVYSGVTGGQVPVTIMCTQGAAEYAALWSWMAQIQNPATGKMGFFNDYASGNIMEIELLNRELKPRARYTFTDVRPASISPVQLSWESNNEIMRVDVNFMYRRHAFELLV